jgi:5-methylcytosine-specific restriction endonuclease McrA
MGQLSAEEKGMTDCFKCFQPVYGSAVHTKTNKITGKLEVKHMICPARKVHKKTVRPPKEGRLGRSAWTKRKNECFARDGFKCRACGTDSFLDAHHVIFRSHGGSDDLSNLVTLCRTDHQMRHPEKRTRFGEGPAKTDSRGDGVESFCHEMIAEGRAKAIAVFNVLYPEGKR